MGGSTHTDHVMHKTKGGGANEEFLEVVNLVTVQHTANNPGTLLKKQRDYDFKSMIGSSSNQVPDSLLLVKDAIIPVDHENHADRKRKRTQTLAISTYSEVMAEDAPSANNQNVEVNHLRQMSILSWNCRGLDNLRAVPNIRDLFITYKVDIIFLY